MQRKLNRLFGAVGRGETAVGRAAPRGRNAPLVEGLEDRRLFAVAIGMPAPGTIVFTGDGAADAVSVLDNGMGVIQGTANGAAFGPFAGINHVVVNAGGGNDQVSYTVTADHAANQSVEVSLGTGADVFVMQDMYDIFNAQVYVSVSGGAGNDDLRAYFNGEVDNRLDLILNGNAGNDRLVTDVWLKSVSTGTVFARSRGGDGNDTVDLLVRKANPADPTAINALASGGGGLMDYLTRTALAADDGTFETVVVVP